MYKLLLVIVLYLPFQLALNPASGIDLASIRIIILFLFFLWLAQGLKEKKVLVRSDLQTYLLGSFLFLNVFSIVMAQNTDWSLRKLLFLLSIFPIYFVASQLIADKKRLFLVVEMAVISGSLAAIVGIAQFSMQFIYGLEATYALWAEKVIVPFLGNSFATAVIENPSWLVNIAGKTYLRATSLFPDPHMFSFYLGLLFPLAVGLALHGSSHKRKFFMVMALVILLADVLTFSRGGYLGLFSGLIFLMVFFWNTVEKKYKVATLLFASAALLVMLVPSPISQRFLSSFDVKEGSNQGRIEMWEKAVEVIIDNPAFGVGIGNYPLEVKATAGYREPIYAHNTYLDIAAETGIINALIWLALLMATMHRFWQMAKKEQFFFFVLISILIFATHSLVETAIYSPVVLTLFLIIMSFTRVKLENEKII